ncbi:MAG: PAS domain S-box protein, partial [Methanoregula sp.]|nr:PAS domain S-box protein [Methanoregula sp.]
LPVFFKDAEGKYLGCNPPFEKYIGITCDELIGKTAYDISPGDLADKYTAADRQVLDDPHPQNYETQVQYADGSRHDVIFYQAPFLNKDGSVGGLIGAFLDITERKRMEEALRESESFNRGLVENLPEYIAVYGQDGKILYVNPASAKALGYDAEVLVGTHVLTYIAEEHRDTAKANMATRQTQGNAPPYEIDMVTRDGLRRSVIVKATPIRYRNNPAILLLLIDITERKAAEEALNLSVERFKTVMDSIDALIYVTDMHTFKLLFINKYGRNIWGEIEGKVCWQTIQSGQKGPCPFCTNDRIVDAKGNPTGIYQWEFQNTVNGCWYDCRDSAIPWTDGRLVRMEIASDITRHKLIEISLRESEEKLNRILNDVQDVIWSLSWPDLNIYYISPSAEQVYGRTVQEFIKNPSLWAEVTHPDDRQISEKALEQLRNIGSAVRECRIVRPDGSIVWIHDKSHLIFDEHDTPIRLEGITSDITERKKAEEAIRSREEQFRVIFQTQQTGLIMVDATTHTITDANAAALNMIGASHDEVVGKICHTFICPAEMGKCPVTDLGQTVDSSERVLIRANGERIPILKSVNPVNIGGRPFLIESFIDLTERKRMEAEVTESRQLFADIISFLPDPTFVIDSQGKVLAWNRAIEELSGISAADMIGKGDHEYSLWMYGKRRPIIIDLVLHPDQDAARLDYTTIHWEGHTVTAQTEITLPGREQKISLSLVASPLLDAQEKVAGAIESIRDISSLREAEAALARLNANLEVIVQNRTRALEEEVAQRMHAEKDVQAALSYTRSVIEANPDLMVVLDRNGTILDINAAAEFLTGIPRDQLIGTPYFGYLVDDGTLYTAFSRLLESGMLENVIHIRHTDGHVTPLSVNATMIGGRDATDARIIVSAHDITRQKQDEEAIRSSRQMLTNVVENFPGVVFWKDKNSVYIGCNRNFSDGAGLKDPAEIIGKTDFDLPWAKTEAESYRSFDREVIEGGKSRLHIIETQLQSDGRIIWLDTNKIPLFGPDGTVIGILGTSNDITRQKQDEDSIKASLEEKVILLREVHHRVKNNLQIIISLVNLQMRQTDDPMVKQIMSETQNRVRAMSLVHEKLYRSESLSRIDFADYTRFLATQLFSFYGMDTRRVRLDFAMGGIMVDINTAVPLGLLMNELISNALKHAFPNGREGAISISGGYEEDLITLVVRDNGAGIPADFDWKNTTSLGMRLVTSLIDQVDGTIELDRTNGTVFTITVKRETADKGEG